MKATMDLLPTIDETARLRVLREYCVLDTGPEQRFDDLTLVAARACGTPVALISLVDADRLYFKSAAGLEAREAPFPHAFCGHAIRGRDVFVVPDARQDPRFSDHPLVMHPPHICFYAAAPLVSPEGHAVGTLCVIDSRPRVLSSEQGGILQALARQVIAQLELRRQVIRDPLTGLFNRRYLEETLAREIARAERCHDPVSLVILDVDHFKRVNDTWGHAAGDSVLRRVADAIRDSARREDVAVRLGGEEFAILFPGMPIDVATQRARELRQRIADLRVRVDSGKAASVTVSAGVASIPAHARVGAALLDAADRALYRAKDEGRDCVRVAV